MSNGPTYLANIHYPTFQRLPKSFYLNETDPVGTEVFKVYLWFIIILDQPVSECGGGGGVLSFLRPEKAGAV